MPPGRPGGVGEAESAAHVGAGGEGEAVRRAGAHEVERVGCPGTAVRRPADDADLQSVQFVRAAPEEHLLVAELTVRAEAQRHVRRAVVDGVVAAAGPTVRCRGDGEVADDAAPGALGDGLEVVDPGRRWEAEMVGEGGGGVPA